MKIIKKINPIRESISNIGKKEPLKEGFYEGGFPDFKSFMDVVYEGNTYGDHDVEFPGFPKTIDLIDSIWKEKYSDIDTWDEIPFTQEEKDKIFKSAQDEAKRWDNMDLYNSHARYNHASMQQIKKAIKDAFNVENKYLHESLKKKMDEDFDVNHPIGVLPHADAVATEQHIADRAAGLERRANPDKDPAVKELIDETASEKSRTLHYDVVDRKGLAKILTEAKKNKCEFKVGRSDKAGYRYFVDIIPIYGSKGALEGDDGSTEVDGEPLTESLLKEDIEKELKDYIKWCEDNKREAKDFKSLEDYLAQRKSLTEAKYKTPINDSDEYINALAKAYKALSRRKTGFAAIYGYRKGSKFVPLDPPVLKDDSDGLNEFTKALTTKPKGGTDVQVYTMFKNQLDEYKELLKEKGLLKESLNESVQGKYSERLWNALDQGILDYKTVAEAAIYYLSDADVEDLARANDWVDIFEDPESDDLDEDLQLYTTSLKDFKPAKEAEPLWNEIIEKGKLDDLEFVLEDVFKGKDDENAQIDIEGLNDLLINHPDYIREVIGLDDAPLEDDDYNEEPVGNNEMVFDDDEDEEEPIADNVPLDDEDEEVDPDDVDESEPYDEDEDDVEPLEYDDMDDEYDDYEDRRYRSKHRPVRAHKPEPEEDEGDDKEMDESLDTSDGKECKDCDKHLNLDGDDDLDECDDKSIREAKGDKPVAECSVKEGCDDTEKDDDLTENIAKGFIKSRFTEAKDMSGMTDEEKRQELARRSLASLNESDDTEVIDISDEELTEALGMPTDKDVKAPESKDVVKSVADGKCDEKVCDECEDGKKELDEGIEMDKQPEPETKEPETKESEQVKQEPKTDEPVKECTDAKAGQ